MKLTFLGTGTSHGIPMIGCHCPTCTSPDPRDNRYRSSVLVECEGEAGTRVVVDCPPEFRLQALRAGMDRLDAVLLTHSHADHLFGMDDLRRFNQLRKESIPVYGAPDTLEDVERVFRYAFVPTQWGGGKPQLGLVPLKAGESHCIGGFIVTPLTIHHGELLILGYRIDETGPHGASMAYLTDCSHIPPSTMDSLDGLDLLVMGALRHKPHSTHFTIGQATEAALSIGAKRTYFTHLAHDIRHAEEDALLPSRISLAYDGLVMNFNRDTPGGLNR